MKKIILPGLIAALSLSSVAQAELEVSGNVTTIGVYQHDNSRSVAGFGGATQGDLGIGAAANQDAFRFLVDQVEIDLENEFGDNIRARADIDFRDITNNTVRTGDVVTIEQAYVTANLGAGNGVELLVGKFNSPLGLELNDRNENVFSTYTPGYAYVAPKSLTGAKIYYQFNDNWSFDLAVVNSLNANFTSSAVPGALARVGASWGEEGNESFIHVGGGVSPELNVNDDLDYLATVWGNWSLGDFWDIGWEYSFRMRDVAGVNPKVHTGQLFGVYQASDVWSVQARVAALYQQDAGAFSPFVVDGSVYSGTLGATYQIADDAQVKFEYRYDYANPTGAANNGQYHTGVAEFAYSF